MLISYLFVIFFIFWDYLEVHDLLFIFIISNKQTELYNSNYNIY